MKKIYFLILALCFFNGLKAQVVNIPDSNFKTALISNKILCKDVDGNSIKIDKNNNGEIETSEALSVYQLIANKCLISDLTGINDFKNLTLLHCYENSISTLDLSNLKNLNTLDCRDNLLTNLNIINSPVFNYLDCSNNKLTNLNLTNAKDLVTLNCKNNLLSSIDFDNKNLNILKTLVCNDNAILGLNLTNFYELWYIDCHNNSLKNLELQSGSKLGELNCSQNKLTNLVLSDLPNLSTMNSYDNLLTSVTLNKLPLIIDLILYKNKLATIDLSNLSRADNKLNSLNVGSNLLTSINLGSIKYFTSLNVANNKLTDLNFLPAYKGADYFNCSMNLINSISITVPASKFYCSNNPLTSLDISGFMETFECTNTLLQAIELSNTRGNTSFDVSNNKDLKFLSTKNGYINSGFLNNCPKIKFICADDDDVKNLQNAINNAGYLNCAISSYCSFTPGGTHYVIQGNHRLDSNMNGCDNKDIVVPNLKFKITDGVKTGNVISNSSGGYSIPVKEGTHKITPVFENPDYFIAFPENIEITFPTQASPFIQDFCVTANGVHPDLEVSLLPIEEARPGFDAKYKIVYKNKGNNTQSGTINLKFDGTILNLVTANPIALTQSSNSLTWNFTNLQPFEIREIFVTLNLNGPTETPAVNIGDILNLIVSISLQDNDETPNDNTFTLNQRVVGSFDPNDKTCLEGDVITPSLIGEYVHYMIRFENTGTYSAQNIVVKDMIDLSKFDISTLIPTSSSHSFVTKISDENKVEFIFENINLPFDDANNDGYIAFKIKTKPTLVTGDTFTNDANIYFDYNFPILTNKAISTFKTLGTKDFEFSNYFKLYPIPANNVLNIAATQAIEIDSFGIYDILGQLVIAIPNAKSVSNIDVSKLRTGNYFIKVKSDKGSSSMKFIKL
ncbi:putative repeat protein (TIGR01451 family)/predicted secreted protein (Por secretion system target) [Flavobacterium sp. 90]|uniref:DUF7619 domain-containing protein n=1 Tax=unclassified Flavobacterium TaxID=196869 RepID=UPI000EAC07F8|nr:MULTISPECIES: T9SS type A sorting domain-containing protein [unclassified Flavobacterium]RKR05248.1 putative repeat protein (TIGR01451 family)/predicted secreted protein (Por secretion system target) [Flavobacterium sp. 81]TCK56563.1 putative repeat protein (TIGR01451 family)/predicted secreted protein (Por secretion system target) [Flavobacterium sp. 90]